MESDEYDELMGPWGPPGAQGPWAPGPRAPPLRSGRSKYQSMSLLLIDLSFSSANFEPLPSKHKQNQ